ncbi:FAD-dependent oxidoreductase [Streptomyces phaeochromogenes]
MNNKTRAVVIGASMSGLWTAAALSHSFDQVVVVERDRLPAGPDHRRAVPQSRHLHGLMARGLAAMESLLPGFEDDLAAAGAVRSDLQSDIHWYLDGHLVKPEPSGITGYSMTRPLLEHVIRTRVRALPGVSVIDHCDVLDLITADGVVTGARVLSRADGAEATDLAADLVIDAAGRASRTPQWLTGLGYAAPTQSTVPVGITYVSREYRREPRHLDGRAGHLHHLFPRFPSRRLSGRRRAGHLSAHHDGHPR